MSLPDRRFVRASSCVAAFSLAAFVTIAWLGVPRPAEARTDKRGRGGPSSRTISIHNLAAGTSGEPSILGASFVDIPSLEIQADASIALVPPSDRQGRAFALLTGEVCVLMIEGFTLRAQYSNDGGSTFSPEFDVAGGGGGSGGAVHEYSASLSHDGRLYVAYVTPDPGGDLGLWFTRSDDMGRNWTAPAALVAAGDPSMGVRGLVLGAGPSGLVSIIYEGDQGWDPYAITSADFGVNWTLPVRLNAGSPARDSRVESVDVAIDFSGEIHAAWTQPGSLAGSSVWTARSSNGGISFTPERSLDSILPDHGKSERVDIEIAADGQELIAFWDSGQSTSPSDWVYAARSNPMDPNYILTLARSYPSNHDTSFPVVVATAPGTPTTYIFTVDRDHVLLSYRSISHGANFDPPETLSTGAAGSPAEGRPYTRIPWARVGANWFVGWSDHRADTYARWLTDVYVRGASDLSAGWGPPVRVDSDLPGSSASAVESVVATDPNSIFVLFQDGRPDDGRGFNYWGNVSATGPIAFGQDYRIDSDGEPVSVTALGDVAVTSDGGSNIYVAFAAVSVGPFPSVHVGIGSDFGVSFVTMTAALGGPPLGSRIEMGPAIKATSDGFVHVAWTSDDPGGLREVRFNRSNDFGATWLPADKVLGAYAHEPGSLNTPEVPSQQIAAVPGGTAHIVWSDGSDVHISTWDENTLSITTQDVDQNSGGRNDSGRICADANQIVVVFRSPNLATTTDSVWATVSGDGGGVWETRVQLRDEMAGGSILKPDFGCFPVSGTASVVGVAAWPDRRSGPGPGVSNGATFRPYSNRFDGTAWSGETPAAAPGGLDFRYTVPRIVSATAAVLSFEDTSGRVHVGRTTGGTSFDSYVQIDLGAPDPNALSVWPVPTTDGQGNVWVSWLDWSAGLPEVAVAHSADAGASFGPVMRLSRTLPQGSRLRTYDPYQVQTGSLPGVAFIPWVGEGDAATNDVLINSFSLHDTDRDGWDKGLDCDDTRPGAWTIPHEPIPVTMTAALPPLDGVRLNWPSQEKTAGPDTSYDIVTGRISDLLLAREYADAMCLVPAWPDTPFEDPRPGPEFGDCYYYLIRAKNSCGMTTYGDSALFPDPRDLLDGPWPCP